MKKVLIICCLCIVNMAVAQKFKVTEGSFKNLKGIATYDLVFDYENLKVDKFDTEEDFLKDKMAKREEKGTDEDFKKSWFSDRADRYEPKFIESFNKRFKKGEISVDKNNTAANYTMHIKTTWIYPGYNVGVMRQPAKINATVTVYEKANPTNVLFKGDISKVLGNGAAGFDYNSGYRISEAYALLAKILTKNINK